MGAPEGPATQTEAMVYVQQQTAIRGQDSMNIIHTDMRHAQI